MKTSEHGINLIKRFEGLRLEAYKCSAGVWTIGYGYTLGVKQGDRITQEQAEQYLIDYIRNAEKQLNELIKVEVSQNQYDALMSLFYNIGYAQFASSTCLKRLNNKDYKGAAEALVWWNKAGGKILQGLVNRRDAEKELFLQNEKEQAVNIVEKMNVLGSAETFKKVQQVVEQIEFENQGVDGQTKKQIAVDILNKLIDIPFINEGTEAIILGILVDKAVYYFNEFIWKKAS